MNSLSNGNCSGTAGAANCVNPCPPRYIQCTSPDVDLHPAPCPALLECGIVSNPNIPSGITSTAPLFIASVDIDTTCLCFPNLKIEFSTLFNLPALTAASSFTIQLSRICTNAPTNKVILKTDVITLPFVAGAGIPITTLPYSFIYCTRNAPSRSCTYTVEVTASSYIATPVTGTIKADSTQIAALAVGCPRIC